MVALTNNIRFMTNNYAALSGAVVTASSSLVSFPVANVVDERRFEQWVPSGMFEITAANQNLYIDEGGLKTAAVAIGVYTTPAALTAAIETALNAVSSAWTVGYDNQTPAFKFNFRTSIGASEFIITNQTNAIWDTIGFTGSSDIANGAGIFYIPDEVRCHTSEWVLVDTIVANTIDFAALIGPLNEAFSVSSTGTVTLQGNNINDFSSPPFDTPLSVDTFGALQFTDDVSPSFRYWRILIVDKDNSHGPEGFVFGHMYLGDFDTIGSSTVERGFTVSQTDPSIIMTSENGARFFNKRTNFLVFEGMIARLVAADDRRSLQQLFYDLGVTTPFYVSIDPKLEVSEEYQEYTRYVTFQTVPKFPNVFSDTYNIAMSFREAG